LSDFNEALWPRRKHPVLEGWSTVEEDALDRFPQVFSNGAAIPSHQLGWRMAVLPFRSAGAPMGYAMSLGMAEEISAALSRFRSPRLIAPATFWDGAGPAADALARCRMYQLDYVLDGTIEVVGQHIRLAVSLLDVVLDFEVIWSGRLSGRLDDLFALQDQTDSETIAQLDPDLFVRGSAFEAPSKTNVPAAHHALLVAIQGIFRLDQPKFMRARELLIRAIELDAEYAAPHAWLAYWSIMAIGQGWASDPRQTIEMAGKSAERALQLDPLDARAVSIAGHVQSYMFHDVPAGLELHARALELNPNLPIVWTLSSCSRMYNGDHATASRHAAMAQRLSPRDPHIFFVEHVATCAYFFQRNLEQAEQLGDVVLTRNPRHVSALYLQLAIVGHLDHEREASECLALLQSIDPNVSVESIIARSRLQPNDRDYFADGLRRAGVPLRSASPDTTS
jgi:TolB-like protein